MRLSLINATYGDFHYLPGLMSNLNQQTNLEFELIICDQNKSDDLRLILESKEASFKVIYKKVPKIGLSAARNIGLRNATGDIIGFVDDDCTYPENFVEKLFRKFAQSSEIDMLAVSVRDSKTKKLLDFTPLTDECSISKANIFKAVTSVGLFHKKSSSVFFDEKLGLGAPFGSCEEMDYAYQLLNRGLYGVYMPDLYVFHPPNIPVSQQKLSNIYGRSKGHGAYFRKNKTPLSFTIQIILVRPLGGVLLNFLKLKFNVSKRYMYMLIGRITGFLLFRN